MLLSPTRNVRPVTTYIAYRPVVVTGFFDLLEIQGQRLRIRLYVKSSSLQFSQGSLDPSRIDSRSNERGHPWIHPVQALATRPLEPPTSIAILT
jgi:hypothetical protein